MTAPASVDRWGASRIRPPRMRPDARPFDPRHPGRLSGPHRRALALVYEAFTRHFASTLATHLRVPATVTVASVEQRDYLSIVASTADPACLAALTLDPLPGTGVLDVPLPFAMTIIERLLGGSGAGPHPARSLSALETELLSVVINESLPELSNAFGPLCQVDFGVLRYEAKAELLKAATPGEAFAVTTLDVRLGDISSNVTIAIPLAPLEPAFDAFAGTSSAHSSADSDPVDIGELLLDSPVEVSLHFDPVALTGAEILDLHVGDVVRLGKGTSTPLTIDVAGIPLASARPGRVGRRLACILTEPDSREAR